MTLTTEEQAYTRSQGPYPTVRCDGCGVILNQSVRYNIAGKVEVYCSANLSRFSENATDRQAHAQLARFHDLLRRMNFPE